MKTVRKIFIVILGIVILMLVIALFVDKEYSAEQQIQVNRPLPEVFNYVKYLKNQDNYSVWANMDPYMHKEYRGIDGEVGFVSAWESDDRNVGKGEQEIIKITDGERIDYELRFFVPFESTDQAYMITKALNDSVTNVIWGLNGSFAYPMNIFLLTMNMESMLAPDLEAGLIELKKILETAPTQPLEPKE